MNNKNILLIIFILITSIHCISSLELNTEIQIEYDILQYETDDEFDFKNRIHTYFILKGFKELFDSRLIFYTEYFANAIGNIDMFDEIEETQDVGTFYHTINLLYTKILISSGASLKIGKQRINWGNGLYWNPCGFLNTQAGINMISEGTEAVLLDLYNPSGEYNVLFARKKNTEFDLADFNIEDYGASIRYRLPIDFLDYFIFLYFDSESAGFGTGAEGNIWDITPYGEACTIYKYEEEEFSYKTLLGFSWLISMDYLTNVAFEFYYNSAGYEEITLENMIDILDSPFQNMKSYIMASFNTMFLSDFFINISSIFNLSDLSILLYPTVIYSLQDNCELYIKGIFTFGEENTEMKLLSPFLYGIGFKFYF